MDDASLLQRVEKLLTEGLATDWRDRAGDSDGVSAVLARLQRLPTGDLPGLLVGAGFTLQPYVAPDDEDQIAQACATCMYFERHRGWCDLPELMLPVRPEWSCVLWRI